MEAFLIFWGIGAGLAALLIISLLIGAIGWGLLGVIKDIAAGAVGGFRQAREDFRAQEARQAERKAARDAARND